MDKAEIEAIRPARMPEITVGKLGALAAPGVRLSVQHGGRVKTFSPSEAHGGLRGRTIRRLSGMKAAMAEPVLSLGGSDAEPVEIELYVKAVPMPEHPEGAAEPPAFTLMSLHMLCGCPIRVVAWGSGRELMPEWDAQGSRPGIEALEIMGGLAAIPGIEKVGCRRPRLIPMLEAAVDERKFLLAVEAEAKTVQRNREKEALEREAMASLEEEAGEFIKKEKERWAKKGIAGKDLGKGQDEDPGAPAPTEGMRHFVP